MITYTISITVIFLILLVGYSFEDINAQTNNTIIIKPGATEINSQNPVSPENVTAPVGSIITWLNQDKFLHQIVSGTPESGPSNDFYGDYFDQGQMYEVTFEYPGIFEYYDPSSPNIRGQVVIEPNSSDIASYTNNSSGSENNGVIINENLITMKDTVGLNHPSDIQYEQINPGNNNQPQFNLNQLEKSAPNITEIIRQVIVEYMDLNQAHIDVPNRDPADQERNNQDLSLVELSTDHSTQETISQAENTDGLATNIEDQLRNNVTKTVDTESTEVDPKSSKRDQEKIQIQSHEPTDSFKANGKIHSLIVTPASTWNATGDWDLIVNEGEVQNFTTTMAWVNGTSSHTHEFKNFEASDDIVLPSDNLLTLRGDMDVGSNGVIMWEGVESSVILGGGGKTITVMLDHDATDHHFAGQPISGNTISLEPCSDSPGPNMELLPSCR